MKHLPKGVAALLFLSPFAHADWVSDWFAMASRSQAEQPHWATPLATVTPRLEQEFRFDYLHEHLPNSTDVNNYDNGKGLEVIPTENTELLVNVPPYVEHGGASSQNGFGDFSMVGKYRFLSANEQHGNYIVTGFLGLSLPTGAPPNGGQAAVITPTIAGGKGFGDFDVQSTLGVQLPVDRIPKVGRTIAWNTAFQYHLDRYFWPEVEVNYSHFIGGKNDDKTQVLITPGVVFGKFVIKDRLGVVFGAGCQVAATHFKAYDNAVIATARMPF
ncbi:MAG: hypothetical protein P4L83_02935 [Nevskia sp.]|nr:hypothetical protein [Nevskia sp.]